MWQFHWPCTYMVILRWLGFITKYWILITSCENQQLLLGIIFCTCTVVTLLSHNVVFKLQWLYIIINYFNSWCIKEANRTEGMMKVFPEYNDCFSQVTFVDNHKVWTKMALQCRWSQFSLVITAYMYYKRLLQTMYMLSHHTSTHGFTCTLYRQLLIRAVIRDEEKGEWLWSTHAFGCINKNHHTITHSQSCCHFIREVHMACEERITPFKLCTVWHVSNHD